MSIQEKKTSHKQKNIALNLKPKIPQCALIMACRIMHTQRWKHVRQHLENCVTFKIKTLWCYGACDVDIDKVNLNFVTLKWSLKCSKSPFENA